MVNCRAGFQPANGFNGSEAGARCQSKYSISKPRKCCYHLGVGPKYLGFLFATPSTVVYFTQPLESGSWRDCTHIQSHSPSSLPAPCGSEELLPGWRGWSNVPQLFLSPPDSSLLAWVMGGHSL